MIHLRSGARRRLHAAFCALLLLPLAARTVGAQADSARPAPKRWYEKVSLRGYMQLRYNRLFETNPLLTCVACDRSIGAPGGFFIRRARLNFTFDPVDRVTVVVQPDLAQDVAGSQNLLQIRDLYADLWLDRRKTTRLRAGQSIVPFGWENMQSSARRAAFDRSDAINSATPGERDVGLFGYWTPAAVQRDLRTLVDSGLKGTGDFGLVGVGVYNGQGTNRPEANDGRHIVARVTYPFRVLHRQFVELGVQYLRGTTSVPASQRTAGVTGPTDFTDERVAVSFAIYPQPVGLHGEWVWGTGPQYDPATNTIIAHRLNGGYLQATGRAQVAGHAIVPYARGQYFDGGKRGEQDARYYHVRELEIGSEFQAAAPVKVTAAYVFSDRTFEDGARPDNRQQGRLLRLQLQVSY